MRLSISAALSTLAGLAMFAATDAAEARPRATTLYVTRGAPLAIVDEAGNIREASCNARHSRRAGNRIGDEWTRLDASGRPAESVRVTHSSVYDLSGCREIATTGREDKDDAPTLIVRGPRKPSSTPSFACTTRAPATPASLGPKPIVYCTKDASGRETMRAVGDGTSLVFAHVDRASGKWQVDRQLSAPQNDPPTPVSAAFKVVAVLDMNGDGSPEIVVHSRRSDTYADTVYGINAATGMIRRIVETGGGYA